MILTVTDKCKTMETEEGGIGVATPTSKLGEQEIIVIENICPPK